MDARGSTPSTFSAKTALAIMALGGVVGYYYLPGYLGYSRWVTVPLGYYVGTAVANKSFNPLGMVLAPLVLVPVALLGG